MWLSVGQGGRLERGPFAWAADRFWEGHAPSWPPLGAGSLGFDDGDSRGAAAFCPGTTDFAIGEGKADATQRVPPQSPSQ